MATFLFLATSAFQLRASWARWISFPDSRPNQDFDDPEARFQDVASVESHEFDYFFPTEPYYPIENTAAPLGVGLMIQAVGVLFGVLTVLTLRAHWNRATVLAQLPLALWVMLGFALTGYQCLRSELQGHAYVFTLPVLPEIFIGLSFLPLAALCLVSVRRFLALSLVWFFLLGTTTFGYVMLVIAVMPVISIYDSHDTYPGTETVVALSTALAGVAMLVVLIVLAQQRSRSQRKTLAG